MHSRQQQRGQGHAENSKQWSGSNAMSG
jgi:hypothetical protein